MTFLQQIYSGKVKLLCGQVLLSSLSDVHTKRPKTKRHKTKRHKTKRHKTKRPMDKTSQRT